MQVCNLFLAGVAVVRLSAIRVLRPRVFSRLEMLCTLPTMQKARNAVMSSNMAHTRYTNVQVPDYTGIILRKSPSQPSRPVPSWPAGYPRVSVKQSLCNPSDHNERLEKRNHSDPSSCATPNIRV